MAGNVFISHQALEQVFTDSVEANGIEVGGLLVGYPSDRGIHIKRAIPTSRGTITRIPITSEDMARAAEKLDRGEQIVGWYHSHPGHTVFFSQNDIESHERFLEFNPQFQALVIDPVQAEQGDYIVDCVKFYAVRNHRAIEIDDYYITNYSGERLYNPSDFVFDRHGFPHRSQAYVGVTSADDRELRQRLRAALEERDELQDNYVMLWKKWKSTYHFSRRIFPFALIFSILTIGLVGFTLGVIVSQVPNGRTPGPPEESPGAGEGPPEESPGAGEGPPEEPPGAGEGPLKVNIQNALLDWKDGRLEVIIEPDGLSENEDGISLCLWFEYTDAELPLVTEGSFSSSDGQMKLTANLRQEELKDYKYVSIKLKEIDISEKHRLEHKYFVKIEENTIDISEGELKFTVILKGPPIDKKSYSCEVYLCDSESGTGNQIFSSKGTDPELLDQNLKFEQNKIHFKIKISNKNDLKGKYLYIKIIISGIVSESERVYIQKD